MAKIITVSNLDSGLKEINEFENLMKVRGVLAIVGESPSGKTTLVKEYLKRRGLSESEYYLNVNDFIMKTLEHMKDYKALELDDRRGFLDSNRDLIEKTLSQKFSDHFKRKKLLVLDSIELLYKYEINLTNIAYDPASSGKTCIICIPGSISGEKIYFMGKPGIISYHHCDMIIQIERRK